MVVTVLVSDLMQNTSVADVLMPRSLEYCVCASVCVSEDKNKKLSAEPPKSMLPLNCSFLIYFGMSYFATFIFNFTLM